MELTQRELNRALLARQLLLERSRTPLVRRSSGSAGSRRSTRRRRTSASGSRLDGFRFEALTRALEQDRVVQATLLRGTIHVVSRADYWPFAEAIRRDRREQWYAAHANVVGGDLDLARATRVARKALADGPRRRDGARPARRRHRRLERRRPRPAARAAVGHVGAPPRRPLRDRGEPDRPAIDLAADALDHLLRRYLAAFGPATLADAANWAGVKPATLRPAAERAAAARSPSEDGRRRCSTCRARRSRRRDPAPVRFLPTWDATLLVHARRTQILPERFRSLVFDTKTPHSVADASSSTAPSPGRGASETDGEGRRVCS